MKKEDIITKLAASSLSSVFSGPPGVGKTTAELALIAKIYELYPDAQVYVAAQKYDPWCGLWRVPGACVVLDNLNFQLLIQQVDRVFNILTERKFTPPEERDIFQFQPVWLILGDWSVTSNTLSSLREYRGIWNELRAKLGSIITLGREFRCGVVIDTHSFNIYSLGLAKDTQIRDCLSLCILGKISRDEFGMEQGNFEPIAKAIYNRAIVGNPVIREQLGKDLIKYQRFSDQADRPLLFTTMGYPPRLMLLPDLRSYRSYELPRIILERFREKINPKQEVEEFFAQTEQQQSQQHSLPQDNELEELANELELDELPLHLKAIIDFYLQHPDWISARNLRNKAPFKRKGSHPGWTADEIREAFRELVSLGVGVSKGEGASLQWALKQQP